MIAIYKRNTIITILRTWFRWDDAFEQPSISVEEDPHRIIPAEIATNLHLAQAQLLNAVESDASKERFSVGNTATDLPIELQHELLKARQTFAHDSTHDDYNLGYSNELPLPKLTKSELLGDRNYFYDNRLNFIRQIHTLPLSARVLSGKQRFSSRRKFVTHLTTHKNRESNDDLLCQANCCESMFRPTSEDITSSVERETHFLNQSHHEETIIMNPAPRSQSNLPATSCNSYQSTSTSLASSNR